jgi:hypothetical protein
MRGHVLAVLVCLGAMSAVAHADPRADAKAAFAEGEARYRAGDYRAAILAFQRADALAPSAILSYDIALCHERLGEDAEAAARFQEYLQRSPRAANRKDVEARAAAATVRARARRPTPTLPAAPGPVIVTLPAAPTPAATLPAAPAPTLGPATPTYGPEPAPPGPPPPPATVDDGLVDLTPRGDAELAPRPSEPMPPPTAPHDRPAPRAQATPFYKDVWFWVVVGASTILIIDMARDPGTTQGGATRGAIQFRF